MSVGQKSRIFHPDDRSLSVYCCHPSCKAVQSFRSFTAYLLSSSTLGLLTKTPVKLLGKSLKSNRLTYTFIMVLYILADIRELKSQ